MTTATGCVLNVGRSPERCHVQSFPVFHAQSGMRQGVERGRSLTRQASTSSLGAVHEHAHDEGGSWLAPFSPSVPEHTPDMRPAPHRLSFNLCCAVCDSIGDVSPECWLYLLEQPSRAEMGWGIPVYNSCMTLTTGLWKKKVPRICDF